MKIDVVKINKAKCLACGDIIESKHNHDFVTCSCGNISVDGGLYYLRRCVKDFAKFEDLSETVEIDENDEENIS